MYRRAVAFTEGETLFACSVCGFPYLFPSELTYTAERTFRCKRTCLDNETKLESDQRHAAFMSRPADQTVPLLSGPKPSWR